MCGCAVVKGRFTLSKKGTLYFFTGLSGAGKSTIGGLFFRRLKARNNATVLIDGDLTRAGLNSGKGGYSTQARMQGALEIVFPICRMLTDQGIDVVCCAIAMYHQVREWNRKYIENYREIYIKVSMQTLYQRDQKQLYSSGAKDVVGVDLPWDEPQYSDFVLENDGAETPEELVARLEEAMGLLC